MEIIKRHEADGWITAIIEGRWVLAKVYDEPSVNSVNNGRVSKLCISMQKSWNPYANFFDQMAYNYDRGLDFHIETQLPQEKLDKIIEQLEKLPKLD